MSEKRLQRGSCVFAYARVSTIDQLNNSSIQEQLEQLEHHAENRGYTIVQIYQEAKSGKDTEHRAEFLRMMEDLKACENVDGFIAARLDRVSRDLRTLLEVLDELRSLGKHIEVIDIEQSPFTATGRAFYSLMGTLAELDRNQICERTQNGRLAKQRAGGYSHGAPRFGTIPKNGHLMVEPSEHTAIRLISQLRARGKSLREIVNYLIDNNIPTKRGGNWHPSIVSKILHRLQKENG
jgi:site-specific DNA recombinase